MSMMDAGAPPAYMGPTPPDRQELTFGDHLQAALQIMASRPLQKDEMVQAKAFFIGVQQIIAEKTGQTGAAAQPGAEESAQPQGPSNETEDYGAGYGTPAEGNEYGAQP